MGNAAVHAGGCPATPVRVESAAPAVRGTAREPDRSDLAVHRPASGLVSVRTVRFLSSSRRRARALRIPGRVECRAALLRDAQIWSGVRRSTAATVFSRLRQRHQSGIERCARGAGVVGVEPEIAETAAVRVCSRTEAVHDQTDSPRAWDCCACAGCGRRTRRSTT